MSIWKELFDNEDDKYEFEQWLDSIPGDETDEEKYNREMEIQHAHEREKGKYTDAEYEKWLEDNVDDMEAQHKNPNYPEWVINTSKYTMTVSNN